MDSLGIEIDSREAGSFAVAVGNPLGDAPVRPGHVVVRLVLGENSAQVRLAEDQYAVESSRRSVPMSRSQVAFARGLRAEPSPS